MKTLIKVALPVLAFILASAGAVSTNEAKINKSEKTMSIEGFIQNPTVTNCSSVTVDCTEVNQPLLCTILHNGQEKQVWKKNAANACMVTLYRVPSP